MFRGNLESRGLGDRVRHIRRFSSEAHSEVSGEIDVLYIDGAHRFGPARDDIRQWGDRVSVGGTMLIHDAFCSVGVTLAIGTTLIGSRRWHYVGRSGSLVEYLRVDLGIGARLGDLGRQFLQLPWFVRNVLVKSLIMLRLHGVTRLLGHDPSQPWPY